MNSQCGPLQAVILAFLQDVERALPVPESSLGPLFQFVSAQNDDLRETPATLAMGSLPLTAVSGENGSRS